MKRRVRRATEGDASRPADGTPGTAAAQEVFPDLLGHQRGHGVVDQARDQPITGEPTTDGSKESAETKPSRPAGRLVEIAIIGLVDPPERVRALLTLLSDAWEQAMERHPVPPADWYRVEIEKVLEVFRDAAARGNCVVKLLHPPADTERARGVLIPLEGRSDQRAEA